MKVRRYDHRLRRAGRFIGRPFTPTIDFEEGLSYVTGRRARYTRVGDVVTVHVGGRMSLREKRASAFGRSRR